LDRRKAEKELGKIGFRFLREGGKHTILEDDFGNQIQLPRHREIKDGTWRAIKKQAGLK